MENYISIENQLSEMSDYKIEELRQKSRSEADEKLKKINESTQRKIHALEVYVENNRETWENQILNRILRR